MGEALIQFRTNKLLESVKSEQSRQLEWLKAEQGRELERLRAEQSRELERLKEQLSHLGDRGRRSNQMEFVAIENGVEGLCKSMANRRVIRALFFRRSRQLRLTKACLKGLVSKRKDRPYRAGRSKDWVKVKNRSHDAFDRVKDSFS